MRGSGEGGGSVEALVARIDAMAPGTPAPDTVTSGFLSVDRMLGGGFRRQDIVILAGDVGSGKSALALGIAIRAARAGVPTLYLSGEMSPDRLMERALALEGKAPVDDLRQGRLDPAARAAVGGAAHRLRDIPLLLRPLLGERFDEVREALDIVPPRALLVVDSLQLAPSPRPTARLEERVALAMRALKAVAVDRDLTVLATAQLPRYRAARPDPRPTLDDLGGVGTIKQNADLVLAIYREEMYRSRQGVEGATELIVAKNRNGPTGFVDLFFYAQWLRFEDMLDPST
jgi:replicative DNA helicase